MISTTLKAIERTEIIVPWCWIEKMSLNVVLKKRGIFNRIQFYIKRSMDISGKGLLHLYQETSSLIGS